MPTKASKRIVLILITLLYVGLAGCIEAVSLQPEQLTRGGRRNGFPLIYGNGPYTPYRQGMDVQGNTLPLPTIDGKSYNVVYHHYMFLATATQVYYLIPPQALETLSQPPCSHGGHSTSTLGTSCIDLRAVSGAAKVATVYDPLAIAIEAFIFGLVPAGLVFWTWKKYCG
jgi:hypothetical protein